MRGVASRPLAHSAFLFRSPFGGCAQRQDAMLGTLSLRRALAVVPLPLPRRWRGRLRSRPWFIAFVNVSHYAQCTRELTLLAPTVKHPFSVLTLFVRTHWLLFFRSCVHVVHFACVVLLLLLVSLPVPWVRWGILRLPTCLARRANFALRSAAIARFLGRRLRVSFAICCQLHDTIPSASSKR